MNLMIRNRPPHLGQASGSAGPGASAVAAEVVRFGLGRRERYRSDAGGALWLQAALSPAATPSPS